METKWEIVHVCAPDDFDTSVEFTDPREHDYWNFYNVVIETALGASMYYTERDNQGVPEEEQVITQMVVELPVVFEEWHDEEE